MDTVESSTVVPFKSVRIFSPKYGTYEMIFSPEKYPLVVDGGAPWGLRWDPHANTFYAMRTVTVADGKRTTQQAHRLLMDCPPRYEVDHRDHCGLNNTDANLRIVSHRQNTQNAQKRITSATSKYKGVYRNKRTNRWYAAIAFSGKRKHLGSFASETDAARAYDAASLLHHGDFGLHNNVVEEAL
jgi:hypothetical protein